MILVITDIVQFWEQTLNVFVILDMMVYIATNQNLVLRIHVRTKDIVLKMDKIMPANVHRLSLVKIVKIHHVSRTHAKILEFVRL